MTVAITGRRERRARNRLNFGLSNNNFGGALETQSLAMQINSSEIRFPVSSDGVQEVHRADFSAAAKHNRDDCVTKAKQHSENAAHVAQFSQPKQLFSIIVADGYEIGEHFDIPRTFQQSYWAMLKWCQGKRGCDGLMGAIKASYEGIIRVVTVNCPTTALMTRFWALKARVKLKCCTAACQSLIIARLPHFWPPHCGRSKQIRWLATL